MSRLSKSIRKLIAKRAHNCCEYCKLLSSYSPEGLTIDHIYPVSLTGTDNFDNLALCCRSCNQHKYNAIDAIDPETNSLVPLYNPREDKWETHFQWNSDFSLIKGLTNTGRATIKRLNMNNEPIVNLRRVTLGFGHPPN